ncbi:hypothetical protein SMSP1_01267 [Sedimentisphaera salicampi]|nr:hypothetical protein SMSP1_01267 [Sedimentisphaera salicampi]
MRPFVGEFYSANPIKTLLIAESFYLPNECELHKDAEEWYASNESDLDSSEKPWVDCRGLIECDWFAAGHFLYRELDRCLCESTGIGFEGLAFMNAFQRPSCREGESFKHFCTNLDIEKSSEVINVVQEVLLPDHVIFVAKYPWDVLGAQVTSKDVAKKYDFVCHPGTGGRYWHNVDYQHGKQKFLKIMKMAGEQNSQPDA